MAEFEPDPDPPIPELGTALETMPSSEPPRAYSRARDARRDLLQDITTFALKHDIEVTGLNLALVCNALSGANGELARIFTERALSGAPFDQPWLDRVMQLDPASNARLNQLEKVMEKLDESLSDLSQTAETAQSEAASHHERIGGTIAEIAGKTGDDRRAAIEELLANSRSLLDRIEDAECGFERSRRHSDALRERLAQARQQADSDQLTGLPNRRAFERRFAQSAQEAQASGGSLTVAFIEVDNLAQVTAQHGSEAGERVLCAVAHALAETTSDTCFAARNRGEEFVLLFDRTAKEDAWRQLDGIRRAQAYKQMRNRETGKPFGKVTISAGLADVADDPDPRSALIRADHALFEARETGRNKVVAY